MKSLPNSPRTAAQRLITWILVLTLCAIHGAPLRKQYRCEVTGASGDYCCGVDEPAAQPACSSGGCCTDESEPAGDEDCDCCEVTFEKDGLLAWKSDQSREGEVGEVAAAQLPEHGSRIWIQGAVLRIVRPRGADPDPDSGVPVYLRCCVFLS